MDTNGKTLSESYICDRYITPAIVAIEWDQATQIFREYTFTNEVLDEVCSTVAKWRAFNDETGIDPVQADEAELYHRIQLAQRQSSSTGGL